jgi:8-hydroxy-5-deazaflavin:NADPH oxidoreductase
MDVAIIGAGNVGEALAGSLTRAGHVVTVTASTEERAAAAAERTGATAVASTEEAVAAADAVILAVPNGVIDRLLEEIGPVLAGKILIDATNRISREDPAAVLDGTSNAERIQALVPEARVVKAFNYAFAARMAEPNVDGTPLDGFVAADDQEARARVLDLLGSMGFRPIDAGPLAMSRALEALATLIVSLRIRHGWGGRNGWALAGPTD